MNEPHNAATTGRRKRRAKRILYQGCRSDASHTSLLPYTPPLEAWPLMGERSDLNSGRHRRAWLSRHRRAWLSRGRILEAEASSEGSGPAGGVATGRRGRDKGMMVRYAPTHPGRVINSNRELRMAAHRRSTLTVSTAQSTGHDIRCE